MSIDLAPRLIRASAGTGKTFRLSNRFIGLLLCGEAADKILATTFTRKAAGEIQERVFERLAHAARNDQAAAELGEHLGMPLSADHALETLQRLVSQQHRLQICTLDSFCIQVARCFSLELGLLPGWGLLDEATGAKLRQRAIAEACRQPDSEEFIELLRMMNRGEITRSVQQRLESQILGLYPLFLETDQGAWEWLEPPTPLSSEAISDLQAQLLDLELPRTGKGTVNKNWERAHSSLIQFLQKEDWAEVLGNGLVKKILESAIEGEPRKFSRAVIEAPVVKVIERLLEHVAAVKLSELARQTTATYRLIDLFHAEYANLKFLAGVLQFDDVKRLLATQAVFGRLGDVYYRLDGKIKHVLLDEFQDTSRHEWMAIEPIIDELLAQSDGEHSFFCVGDVKQAIYGWRGGVAAIFDSLESRWPQLQKESMEMSYRSSKVVMDFVNQVFQSLPHNPALAALSIPAATWAHGFNPHSSARADESQESFPGFVQLNYFSDSDEAPEATEQLAAAVKKLLDERRDIEIGILVRANAPISRIIFELSRLGVPASGEGGSSLLDSAAVTPILALLHLIDHPGDTASAFHVANSPLADLLGAFNWQVKKEVDAVIHRVQNWVIEQGLPRTLDLLADEIAPHCSGRDKRRLEQLVELAHEFPNASVTRFGEFVDFAKARKVEDIAQTAVRVMTVHQSKGLEFDAVFLPELDGGLDRSSRSRTLTYRESPMSAPDRVSMYPRSAVRALDPRLVEMHAQCQAGGVQEELSVLYVALTRARQALYLFADTPRDSSRYPATAAGVIRAALGDALQESGAGAVFKIGNPQWFTVRPHLQVVEQEIVESATPILEFTPGMQRKRGLPRKAPSSEEGGGVGITELLTRQSDGGARAAARGTMLHLLFEQVGWLEEFHFDQSALVGVLQANGASLEIANGCVEEFQQMLRHEEVRTPLMKSTYQELNEFKVVVEQELPFAVREGDTLVSTGIIDRLVLCLRGDDVQQAHVIDFKSDRPGSGVDTAEWLSKKEGYYRPQVHQYVDAVQTLYGIEKQQISATLLFLTEGVSTEVLL